MTTLTIKNLSCCVGWVLFFILLVNTLYTQLIESFTYETDPKLDEIKNIISPLFGPNKYHDGALQALNSRDILDEIRLYKGNKSYTINKEKVFICLKDRNNNYYDTNMLVYVTLHELAHVINPTVGHDSSFHQVFDKLLLEAEKMKIYDPNMNIDSNYCT